MKDRQATIMVVDNAPANLKVLLIWHCFFTVLNRRLRLVAKT